MKCAVLLALALSLLPTCNGMAREWSDATGHYKLEADLIARDEKSVVLQKPDKNLVIVTIDQLREADQEYLATQEAETAVADSEAAQQTWHMRSGLKVRATAVEYARREVTVKRQRGKIYVNDKHFENLPEIYRHMLPQVVAHFENSKVAGERGLKSWALKLKGKPRTFTCDGVLLELENGDMYIVPFFFFSDEDQKLLKPGWDEWIAAEVGSEDRSQQSLEMHAQTMAYKQQEDQEKRDLTRIQFQLQAYQAGLFDLWQVRVLPANGIPITVVVPARNSAQAMAQARTQYPGCGLGAAAKVRRKY